MLPLNQKQISQYKWMRAIHLLASGACIPLALHYYLKQNEDGDFMVYGFVATLYCLAVILFFRQYLFPADFKGAFTTTTGLIMNFCVAYFLTEQGWLFSCYYVFFSFLCLQALVLVGLIIFVLIDVKYPVPFFNQKNRNPKDAIYIIGGILLIGSPLLAAPYYMGGAFIKSLNNLSLSDAFWVWGSFCLDLIMQLVVMYKLVYADKYQREINKRQSELLKKWEAIINMVFFVCLLAIFWVIYLSL